MDQFAAATQFQGLIAQELDVEALLRTTLEFVLGRSGPTNAAVFLPSTSGDFALGAYVNYDGPKDSVDVLFDHMASAIAPRFAEAERILHLNTRKLVARYIQDDADWMDQAHVVAFSCRHEGETLAVCLLFRDAKRPFPPELLAELRAVKQLFTSQLAKVIRIHHRHLPKHKWGLIGDDADEGDGYGGLAA